MQKRLPRLADPVIYHPRVPYGRQSELAAHITRVWDATTGDVDLIVFSADGEPQRISHAMRKSETILLNSWEFVRDDVARLEAEIASLRADVESLKSWAQDRRTRLKVDA